MKLIIFILLVLFTYSLSKDIYISPFGNDNFGDGTKNNPFFSLGKAHQESAEGDRILVERGVYSSKENYVVINKPLTITSVAGPNETVFSSLGNNLFITFKLPNGQGKRAYLNGITFTSGNEIAHTGIQISSGSLSINNCIFENKEVGVDVYGGEGVNIRDTKFKSNKFPIKTSASQTLESLEIYQTEFRENVNAVTLEKVKNAKIHIRNCMFVDNKHTVTLKIVQCNAIITETTFSNSGALNFTLANATLERIKIEGSGAGQQLLYIENSNVNLNGVKVAYNSKYPNYGGCIRIEKSSVHIQNSHFHDCNAVYGGCLSAVSSPKVIIEKTIFNNCKARIGGAVYLYNIGSPVEIKDSIFLENIAVSNTLDANGGAICIDTPTQIINSIFRHNSANFLSPYWSRGGALYILKDSMLKNVTVEYNNVTSSKATSESAGGGIFYSGGKHVLIGSKIQYNEAHSEKPNAANGGGIALTERAQLNAQEIIINQNYAMNGSGGGLYLSNSAVNLFNSGVTRNVANIGGAGQCVENSTIYLSNSKVSDNQSSSGDKGNCNIEK